MSDGCSDRKPYGPLGLDAALDMSATLTAHGLLMPVAPRHIVPVLLTPHAGCISPNGFPPNGWDLATELGDRTDEDELLPEPPFVDDPVLAVALRHLARRTAGQPATSDRDES